ncbi:MAG: hypothetical protein FWF57_01775 [Defluviitaleaceae bacterium]|nr:hypothetical protein [Defluviitaleaceae bacterium]
MEIKNEKMILNNTEEILSMVSRRRLILWIMSTVSLFFMVWDLIVYISLPYLIWSHPNSPFLYELKDFFINHNISFLPSTFIGAIIFYLYKHRTHYDIEYFGFLEKKESNEYNQIVLLFFIKCCLYIGNLIYSFLRGDGILGDYREKIVETLKENTNVSSLVFLEYINLLIPIIIFIISLLILFFSNRFKKDKANHYGIAKKMIYINIYDTLGIFVKSIFFITIGAIVPIFFFISNINEIVSFTAIFICVGLTFFLGSKEIYNFVCESTKERRIINIVGRNISDRIIIISVTLIIAISIFLFSSINTVSTAHEFMIIRNADNSYDPITISVIIYFVITISMYGVISLSNLKNDEKIKGKHIVTVTKISGTKYFIALRHNEENFILMPYTIENYNDEILFFTKGKFIIRNLEDLELETKAVKLENKI